MKKKTLTIINDHQQLTELMEFAWLKVKMNKVVVLLNNQFKGANMLLQESIAWNTSTVIKTV